MLAGMYTSHLVSSKLGDIYASWDEYFSACML